MPMLDQRGSEVMVRSECLMKLARAAAARQVGRVAVTVADMPYVVPVDFAIADGEVVVRTGPGLLARRLDGGEAAFEVDDVEDLGDGVRTGWSVLVRGTGRRLTGEEVAELGHRGPRPSVETPGGSCFAIRLGTVTGRKVGWAPWRGARHRAAAQVRGSR